MSKNYYEILNINKNATREEIKRAFYKQAKIFHPDVNHSANAADCFRLITTAYVTLYDNDKRKDYDEQLTKTEVHNATYCQTGNRQEYRYSDYHSQTQPYNRPNAEPETYCRKKSETVSRQTTESNSSKKIMSIRNIFLFPIYAAVCLLEMIVKILGFVCMLAGILLFTMGIVMSIIKFVQKAPPNPDTLSWLLVTVAGILLFILPSIIISGVAAAKEYLHDIVYH